MTSSTSDSQSNQSFLSKLRERSAIAFTIGLAISVASFVENLHMGKDAIAYVVAELSKIDGWADAVNAVAAIFHAGLEWWRGVLAKLLSLLPFYVPPAWHDPISVLSFTLARALNRLSNRTKRWYPDPQKPASPNSRQLVAWKINSSARRGTRAHVFRRAIEFTTAFVALPMFLAMWLDSTLWGETNRYFNPFPYLAVLAMLAIIWLGIFLVEKAYEQRRMRAWKEYPSSW